MQPFCYNKFYGAIQNPNSELKYAQREEHIEHEKKNHVALLNKN